LESDGFTVKERKPYAFYRRSGLLPNSTISYIFLHKKHSYITRR